MELPCQGYQLQSGLSEIVSLVSSFRPSSLSHVNSESDRDCDKTEEDCSSQKDPKYKPPKRKRKSSSVALYKEKNLQSLFHSLKCSKK